MRKTLHEVNAGESPLLVTHGGVGGVRGEGTEGETPMFRQYWWLQVPPRNLTEIACFLGHSFLS